MVVVSLILFAVLAFIVLSKLETGKEGLASTTSSSFFEVHPSFHVIVLTMNRPKSLQRLLHSIEAAEYGEDVLSVEIRVDGGEENSETMQVAKSFAWPYKKVVRRATRDGLRTAWWKRGQIRISTPSF